MAHVLDQGGFPAADAAARAHDDAARSRAVTAYRFWYPTVSMEGILTGNREIGLGDNEVIPIMATGPRQVGFTLNSDTPYGSATLDLRSGPMVIELPPGPYMGMVDDHHQRWVMDMGIPGPDAGKGGRHLVVPPGYEGGLPTGHHIGRAESWIVMLGVRALPVDGTVAGAMEALRAIRVYPLATADDPALLRFEDITDRDTDTNCLRWENDIGFWETLHRVIDDEPMVEGFRPMYGLLAAIGIEKGRPFAPDERMRTLLDAAAKAGREQMLVSAFASRRPDRVAWPDRQWEWASLVQDNADFETPTGLDLEARDRWFAQAIVTSPAMFRRQAGGGSLYWLGARDAAGEYLDGGATYRLRVPQPVPGKLFWSITVYDAATRSQVQSDQGTAALRSLFELKDVDRTQPLDLWFGPEAPAGEEGRWVQTVPGRGWFTYLRIYGPEQAAFDGTWRPDDFERQ